MPECVGVRFDNGPKLHFLEVPSHAPKVGSRCVAATRRGLELGLVRTAVREVERPSGHFVRDAQPDDLAAHARLKEKAEALKWLLRARARERNLAAKIVHLEFTLDEALLLVTYSSEAPLPLRALTQELMQHTGARIEFDNVGPRDQARILGTLGACGSGSCSSTWLQSFSAVSIRMARDQQLPLNPEKISGPCGRLMCCLQYEHDLYKELLKDLPKKGARACHKETGACGRVVKLNPLKGTAELAFDDGGVQELRAELLERPHKASPKQAAQRRS
ncbi:PSP1 domain-containing protein [Truepera radiovictrix]|uniref:PSP1 domain protein n=1 Tax=Truepera radiovictrix (strain DSM 17093 / CIP 108686 / LMG 22925 / RQ-24) TaxID=649638 RepID=D7CUC9_TRURR|nr:regulatory iron-sulfur-containing complex subunit RicT [Truepera radiovictrix]ADI15714.1 PSP1 domain protein [Truepera radiovictrix DSM 17093]WMT58660.1 regulatory iron-sulfur-containing complex subunit RicT [Truepera radiovictrix]